MMNTKATQYYLEQALASIFNPTPHGIPWRLMDFDGNLNIPGQNFIGAYEIGAYVMALSDLLMSPL
jgi:hypothetical protein